ncbi:ferric citrate ABC transporter ATP-binding protein FecE, partial [Vibrio alfacsensis]
HGTPKDVFTQSLLKEVFDLDALVIEDPISGSPMCVAR